MTGLPDPACLLVVAPHPDDEVLGCGYLMRRVAARGGAVVVAWLTDGGASHGPLEPCARAALVATRQREALAGLAALAIEPVAAYFLGHPDGALGDDPARLAEAAAALDAICRDHGVDAVAVTSASDGHPDHRAGFAIVDGLAGCHRFEYFVSARYDGDAFAPPDGAFALDDPAAAALKRRALACHASQAPGAGARSPMTAEAAAHFCAAPEFFRPIVDGPHGG